MADTQQPYDRSLFDGLTEDSQLEFKNVMNSVGQTYIVSGARLGRYQVIEEIDRGGMAVVYKACQLDLDRFVALKVLPANITINKNFVDRFWAEAHAIAKLHHPNIVDIYEVAVEENIHYLAMEYIAGKNLYYFLNNEKPKLIVVIDIIRQLAEALSYAHEQKILHRDLKLNNVLMKNNNTPVLIDFGLAKMIENTDVVNLTIPGEIVGSPAYMAPERLLGKAVDVRSDICSLGIMLYEMLTFKNPYLDPRSILQTTKNVLDAKPVPPRKLIAWLPAEVEAITLKAMHPDPENRYQTMQELADDITRYQKGESVHAAPPSFSLRVRHFFQHNWIVFLVISNIFFVLSCIALFYYFQQNKQRSHWQVMYDETFDSDASIEGWSSGSNPGAAQRTGVAQSQWKVFNNSLNGMSNNSSFLRLEQNLPYEVRIECDVRVSMHNFTGCGLFFAGSTPNEGYSFYIHQGENGVHGVTSPESNLLIYDYNPVQFPFDTVYHVVIQRHNNQIHYWLNNVLIARFYDHFPPMKSRYTQFGFFIQATSVSIDNVQIFRNTTPRLTQPTIVADRLWQQGNFNAALHEYQQLLSDFMFTDLDPILQQAMIDCCIRLNRIEDAQQLLTEVLEAGYLKDSQKPLFYLYAYLVASQIEDSTGIHQSLRELIQNYPRHPVTQSMVLMVLREVDRNIDRGILDHQEMLRLLSTVLPCRTQTGRLCLKLMNVYSSRGAWKEALVVGETITQIFSKRDEIAIEARIAMAQIHYTMAQRSEAIEMLNQCIIGSKKSGSYWHAWFTLAEIYECENNFRDALSIYAKISSEGPLTLVYAWVSRMRTAELLYRKSTDTTVSFVVASEKEKQIQDIYYEVINGEHAFGRLRLAGLLLTSQISPLQFKRKWLTLYPNDPFWMYYLASISLHDNNHPFAQEQFNSLLRTVKPGSWDYVCLSKELDNLSRVAY